jgi:tRNA threonylcarbamoyladenosine biosynthesis protein TsaB
MTLRLLAFDTATEILHLSLRVGATLTVMREPGGAKASSLLLPAIQRLLAEADLRMVDLDAIAFGRGPGAFTGLRTACAVAQGLAEAVDKPVLALDTLALLAESARRVGAPARLWTAVDARMGEVYAARWSAAATPGHWVRDSEVLLCAPQALREAVSADGLPLAGPALNAYAADLQDLGDPAWAALEPDGASLDAVAASAWARGEALDATLALPLYVRDKVAQTTAERAAGRQAGAAA